jgi:carboxylesterase
LDKQLMNPLAALQNPHLDGGNFTWEGGPVGILLLHGFTATTAEVRPLAELLHQQGYTVSGPLLPGFGTSPEDANRCVWQDWVAAARAAYQQLTESCIVVFVGGESMGGLLALYLASQQPQIAGLLLYAPALKSYARFTPLAGLLLSPFIQTVRKKPVSTPTTDARWQGYQVYPLPAAVQMFKLARLVRRRLPAVQQPLLIVQGRRDFSVHPTVPEIITRQAHSEIKEVHWMEHSTHCVILDDELEQVAELTLQFLDRVRATRRSCCTRSDSD